MGQGFMDGGGEFKEDGGRLLLLGVVCVNVGEMFNGLEILEGHGPLDLNSRDLVLGLGVGSA